MKRTKLKDRVLPKYTKGEEVFNMVTHIVGGGFAIIALISCIVVSLIHNNYWGLFSGIVYGMSMILLYTMSSIYHGLSPNLFGKRVLQVLDHCTIFFFIAGSYTTFILGPFREYDPNLAIVMLIFIWCAAAIGIVLNSIDLKKYKVFSMICYLAMGWCVLFKVYLLPILLSRLGLIMLVAGGIAFTIGALLYIIGKKHKYIHSIFHMFIVLGTILQFIPIIIDVM